MAASTSILPDKLHEYPQQDVIDGSGAGPDSILDDCLNKHGECCNFCIVTPAGHFARQGNEFAWMRSPTIQTT